MLSINVHKSVRTDTHFQGRCKKQVTDMVQRFWNIIENISPDELGMIVYNLHILPPKLFLLNLCTISAVHKKQWKLSTKGREENVETVKKLHVILFQNVQVNS